MFNGWASTHAPVHSLLLDGKSEGKSCYCLFVLAKWFDLRIYIPARLVVSFRG